MYQYQVALIPGQKWNALANGRALECQKAVREIVEMLLYKSIKSTVALAIAHMRRVNSKHYFLKLMAWPIHKFLFLLPSRSAINLFGVTKKTFK